MEPRLLQMIRAPFLSSILAGIFLSVHISDTFSGLGFLLVLIMALSLPVATNVYNDIYDTEPGTGQNTSNWNKFKGGSGVLLQFPYLNWRMFRLAITSLIIAFLSTFGLMNFVVYEIWTPFIEFICQFIR
jgi:1,4-dihydroxy-2-naphthoate octaprenyltransferase